MTAPKTQDPLVAAFDQIGRPNPYDDPTSPKPAALIGDMNSPAARDSLLKALRKLPENVVHALRHEPIEVPGNAPSAGPSVLGKLLLSLRRP